MAIAFFRFQRRRSCSGPSLLASLALVLCLGASAARAQSNSSTAGQKGAQVYCFMRAAGNNHEVSWAAAYSLVKRQGDGLFKTSPEHAAVMITEAVVQNPSSFPDCGQYLGDLFQKNALKAADAEAGPGEQSPSQGPGGPRSGR